jgi:hypothetical protein
MEGDMEGNSRGNMPEGRENLIQSHSEGIILNRSAECCVEGPKRKIDQKQGNKSIKKGTRVVSKYQISKVGIKKDKSKGSIRQRFHTLIPLTISRPLPTVRELYHDPVRV